MKPELKKIADIVRQDKETRGLAQKGFRIEKDMARRLTKAARELRCTETDVIRAALKLHLDCLK